MQCSVGEGEDSCSSSASPGLVSGVSAGWANISGRQTTAPIPRSYGRSMAYDPVDHYVVLFGGFTDGGYINDTWTFANGTWTELSPGAAPSQRDHSTLVWDPVDGYLLLFGGSGNDGQYGDTWSFLAGHWTQHSPATHPSGRWSASMTWDTADGYALLFGGCNSDNEQDDTWSYLNGNWTELDPAVHPSNRGDAGMTYDPSLGEVLLFGGYDGDSSWAYFNDTWAFHAGNWTEVNASVAPSARTSPAFAYDPWLGGVLLFGGEGPTEFLADTWLFANGNWTQLPTSNAPAAREFGIMATDPGDGYLLLFGGEGNVDFYNDTWVFYTMNASAHLGATTGEAPLTTTANASTNDTFAIASYAWSFGDGSVGTGPFVNHTFEHAGTFVVSLTATDINQVEGIATTTVVVIPTLSLVAVASSAQGAAPLTVNWVAVASGGEPPYRWSWTVGGMLNSTVENFSTTFVAIGHYAVEATVTDASGAQATENFEVNVTAPAPPVLRVAAQASSLYGEPPMWVNFSGSATGGTPPYPTETWEFGDGASSNGGSAAHWYNSSGTFTVTFRVTDSAHASASATLLVVVAPPVTVQATASTNGGAAPVNVSFSATATGGVAPYYFLWSFGDGASGSGALASHVYSRVGTFVASVEALDSGGRTSTFNVSISVSTGVNHPSTTPSSGGGGLSLDGTAVAVGAELALGAVAVAGIVYVARRRR